MCLFGGNCGNNWGSEWIWILVIIVILFCCCDNGNNNCGCHNDKCC